jgi:arabinose-5-phosphate isomerase
MSYVSTDESIIQFGVRALNIESEALAQLARRIDHTFEDACHLILNCQGRVVVTGMGKSGHIARKISATFSSTGTPSFFLHPAEASHGDMGMITQKDVLFALSNSGETEELLYIIPLIKQLGVPLICLTGSPHSTLKKLSDVHLDVSVKHEACPLNLAPTSSTTAALAMGDALAVALLQIRGFTADDFALSHPGGKLGKRLLLKIEDIMQMGDAIPIVSEHAFLSEALFEMTKKRLGMTLITHPSVGTLKTIAGIFTDGDLRRALDHTTNIHTTRIHEVMTRNFKTILPTMRASKALEIMESLKITTLPVINNENHLVGIVHIHDLV